MTLIEDEASLIEQIRALLPPDGGPLILGVDGNEGAGKSTLASSLSAALTAPVIHVDSYAQPNRGKYSDSIRYDDLRADIERQLRGGRAIVVEGVCLRQVLERIALRPQISIYVRLFNARGRWVGAEACDESPVRSSEVGATDPAAPGSIERDVRAYHSQFKPVTRADIIYKVVRKYA
jgi:hypothetical protein